MISSGDGDTHSASTGYGGASGVVVYKQTWKCVVQYISKEGEHVELTPFHLLAPKMDTVYRYLQRRFLRVATKIEDIDVKNMGYTDNVDCLELIEWSDGAITARSAKEPEKVIVEEPAPKANTLAAQVEAILTNALPKTGIGPVASYSAAWEPRVEYPPLHSYDVFTKVAHPGPLYDLGNKLFKSKFYDVFPREK